MMQKYLDLLTQAGIDLDLALTPDEEGSCSLMIDEKLILQISLDKTEENILLGSFIYSIPPGKFRENILINTLKINGMLSSEFIFAFNEPTSELVLFKYLPIENLTADILLSKLELFIETALKWKESLDAGQLIPLDLEREIIQDQSSIFNPPK